MKPYKIEVIDKSVAKQLIVENHYSHKWTSCKHPLGLLLNDEVVGVAVYGFPVGRRVVGSISPTLENGDVLELTRLWVRDTEPFNTESYFLGQTFQWLRKNTDVKVLISYSDPMYGHVGTIYQATNWLYQGNGTMRVKGYLHRVNGELLHPRSCVSKYGTIKEKVLKEIDSEYERIPLKKKHRYIYILDKRCKKKILSTLKHSIKPYPKDNNDCDW